MIDLNGVFNGCFSVFFDEKINHQRFTVSKSKVVSSGGRVEFSDSTASDYAEVLGRIVTKERMPFATLELIAKLLNLSDEKDLNLTGYKGDPMKIHIDINTEKGIVMEVVRGASGESRV